MYSACPASRASLAPNVAGTMRPYPARASTAHARDGRWERAAPRTPSAPPVSAAAKERPAPAARQTARRAATRAIQTMHGVSRSPAVREAAPGPTSTERRIGVCPSVQVTGRSGPACRLLSVWFPLVAGISRWKYVRRGLRSRASRNVVAKASAQPATSPGGWFYGVDASRTPGLVLDGRR